MDGKELNKRQNQKAIQEREGRLQFVAKKWKSGLSLRQIADAWKEETGGTVSHTQVKRDRDELLKQWREENLDDTGDWVVNEVANIRQHIAELYEQWEQTADVRYMQEIRQQEAELRKLLNLYGPNRYEVTGANGAPLIPRTADEAKQLLDRE